MDKRENFYQKLFRHIANNNIYCECWWDSEVFVTEIQWGDWKHEHAYCDFLIKEFAKENGYETRCSVEVTEEDGSDCYSAIHQYRFKEVQNV